MGNEKKKGRVTIPTDVDVVKETLDLVERWGADAIRDCEKVSFCVISKDDVIKEKLTTAYESAIVFGRARILTEEQEIVEAAKRFSLKYNEDEELADREIKNYWNSLCCVEIVIDHLTAKAGLELMGQKE